MAAARFLDVLLASISGPVGHRRRNAALTLPMSHAQVYAAAARLAQGPLGSWMRATIKQTAKEREPAIVGVSLLYSGQVLAGLVASLVARVLWPKAFIIWGGPHVTALRETIPYDEDFGHLVDGFVFGSAEGTFVALLDAVERGMSWPDAVVAAGGGRYHAATPGLNGRPRFEDLHL